MPVALPQCGPEFDIIQTLFAACSGNVRYYGCLPESLNIFGDVDMKRNPLVAFLALLGFALAACNTVQGVGKDIQAGGKAVEKAAR